MRPVEQEWVDSSLDWLLAEFGSDRLNGTVVLPTDDFFPGVSITSSIPDAGNDGSDRAVDFRMKLSYLRRQRGQRGQRVVCGATATPIANSVRELYVVTRQLRPDLLTATGITDFDTWAATFAKVVTAIEVSPTGQGFQMRARLAKYANVPELSLMMRTYGDVRTPEDLALPTPQLTQREDGERAPHIITLDPSPELEEFISGLDERVERIRNRQVEPSEDNMLKVSGEARAASLDLRLIGEQQTAPGPDLRCPASGVERGQACRVAFGEGVDQLDRHALVVQFVVHMTMPVTL